MAKKKAPASDKVLKELRAFGLAYPGAHTKSPWPGHLDLAVNDKTFAYLSIEGEPFSISCKLPQSSEVALMIPFCKPTAYGLGKSGWVSAQFPEGKALPVDMLKEWIDESYRAQAPKKLLKDLAPVDADARPAKKAVAKKPPTKTVVKKAVAKKAVVKKAVVKKAVVTKAVVKKALAKKPAKQVGERVAAKAARR